MSVSCPSCPESSCSDPQRCEQLTATSWLINFWLRLPSARRSRSHRQTGPLPLRYTPSPTSTSRHRPHRTGGAGRAPTGETRRLTPKAVRETLLICDAVGLRQDKNANRIKQDEALDRDDSGGRHSRPGVNYGYSFIKMNVRFLSILSRVILF